MLEAKAQILMQHELAITQAELGAQSERDRLQSLKSHVDALHQKGYATPLEFDQSAAMLARLDPNISGAILSAWQKTMPNTISLLVSKMQTDQQNVASQRQAMAGGAGTQPAPGAAGGEDMQSGAQGPYSEGSDGPEPVGAETPDAAPEQRPPQRQAGTPGAQ
jgi:hypothetical protein